MIERYLSLSESKTIKRKSRERELEILSAALKVLRQNGVTGTTIAMIAAEANCSKETIYNWFGDQTGLFEALIEAHGDQFIGTMKRLIRQKPTIIEQLQSYCSMLLDLVTGEAGIVIQQLATSQNSTQDNTLQEAMFYRQEQVTAIGSELLQKAKNQGLIDFDDPQEISSTLYGLALGDWAANARSGQASIRPTGIEMQELSVIAVKKLMRIYSSPSQVQSGN